MKINVYIIKIFSKLYLYPKCLTAEATTIKDYFLKFQNSLYIVNSLFER